MHLARTVAKSINLVVTDDGVTAFTNDGAIRLANDGAAALVVFVALAAQRIDPNKRLPLRRLGCNACAASCRGNGTRLLLRWYGQT